MKSLSWLIYGPDGEKLVTIATGMYSTKGNLRYDRDLTRIYDKDGDIVKIIEVDSKHTTVDNSKSRSQIQVQLTSIKVQV